MTMSDTTISVESLSKKYKIGQTKRHYDTLRDALVAGLQAPLQRWRRNGTEPEEDIIWALKDVSFEVKRGEVVGVIGRNGAGKSTLLKILSQITEPTSGKALINGRIGSLLEVGTGFHPELTGRENIFLNGAILGMQRVEINRRFDAIVAFSEIERFLDTPVKRYSSGMYVRLAFAVAAHLEPEILLVDEVLAVGDAGFQRKCLGKMEDVAREGRTVLFISHNMLAIQSLCDRALWLEHGHIQEAGSSKTVVSKYLLRFDSLSSSKEWQGTNEAPGNEFVRLCWARVIPEDGTPLSQMTVDTPLRLEFGYENMVAKGEQSVSIHVSDSHSVEVFSSRSDLFSSSRGLVKCICRIPGNLFNDGTYHVMLAVSRDYSTWLYSHDELIVFQIKDVERPGGWLGKWPGVVRPRLEWSIMQEPMAYNPEV
jgi:lipopolysaccharide transport system ATP-binding protein